MSHSPVLIDEANGTRYAICKNCDSNIESWYFDGDDDRLGAWSQFGIFVQFENGSGYLNKNCSEAPIVKTIRKKLVSA